MALQLEIASVLFFGMGVGAFLNPRRFLTPFVGIEAATADGRNEVQAVYGGFGIAMAAVLMLPIWMPAARSGVIIAVACALAGMAAGRMIAAVRERPGRWPLIFFLVEAGGTALLLSAL